MNNVHNTPFSTHLKPLSPKALKTLFIFLCILPFILLPLLSLNSSISGDEPVHYAHAEKVYNYFATKGKDRSALNTPETYLRYYGQSADDLSYRIARIMKSGNPYLTRHLLNSFFGALTILFASLIALQLSGTFAGILTIVFLLLSPVFLGHSFNNVKDIPFALGYVMTLFFLIRFVRQLPRIRILPVSGMIVGTAFSLSVRAGGLLLFPIILMFITVQSWISQPREDFDRKIFWLKLMSILLLIVSLSWVLGILDWPYARIAPIAHPIRALAMMTRYNVSLRQLFEGHLLWSENIPWYYAPKYLLITTPAIILCGLLISISFLRLSSFVFRLYHILLFSTLFPIFWVIIRHSNLYGGIRHLLFIYPLLTVLAAVGWSRLFVKLRKPILKVFLAAILITGLLGPFTHIIRNHPIEYVYFNKISGGMKNAWGKYETDYYYHSLGPAVKWLETEILEKAPGRKLIVASSFPLEPFFLESKNKPELVYVPYYQRGEKDWDYGIFPVAYLSPFQLKNGCWPPAGTVHTITVEGYPVCTVVKRNQSEEFEGFNAYADNRYNDAITSFVEALQKDPCNETALLYLGWSFRKLRDYKQSTEAAQNLMKIHPESEQARELAIWNYLETQQLDKARKSAEELYRLNPKYPPAARFLKYVKMNSE